MVGVMVYSSLKALNISCVVLQGRYDVNNDLFSINRTVYS